MPRNGDTIYGSDICRVNTSNYADFMRKGNMLFMHVYFWPGTTITLAGLNTGVRSAKRWPPIVLSSFNRTNFGSALSDRQNRLPTNLLALWRLNAKVNLCRTLSLSAGKELEHPETVLVLSRREPTSITSFFFIALL